MLQIRMPVIASVGWWERGGRAAGVGALREYALAKGWC